MKLNRKIHLVSLLIIAAFAPYCKGSSQTATGSASASGTPAMAKTSQYIDAQMGGTITLGNQMSLSIPAGSLDASTEISVSQITTPVAQNGVNPLIAFSFDQHGLQFHIPATLKICYPGSTVTGQNLNEDSTAIYHDDDSNYASYAGIVDKSNHCVQTEINHFSTYFAAAQQLLTTNVAPAIGGATFMPGTPVAGIPLKIRSVVTDFNASGRGQVANVWLHYCPNTAAVCSAPGSFTKVAMVQDTTSTVTTNRYTYTLPASDVTTAGITYFIEAIDNLRASRFTATLYRAITDTATGLTIVPASLDIAAGFSRQFNVRVTATTLAAQDIDFAPLSAGNGVGTTALNNQGVWLFSATTSGDPKTTGFKAGSVDATLGSLTASAAVNVWPGQLTAIQILNLQGVVLGSNITLAPNSSFTFDARGLDAFGNFSLVYPAWIVTNPLIGAIPGNGGIFNASGNDGQSGQVLAIVDNIAASITVNIVAPPSVTLSLAGSPFSENGGVATVTANLSQAYGSATTVNLAFSGTAPNTDYIASAVNIVVPAGQTSGSMTLTGVDNAIFDGSRTVIVDITSVVNGTESGVQQVTATIQDDETAPFPIAATPLDGSTNNPVTTSVSVTFSQPMNPATLTTTTSTSCTGSLQLSADNFVTCIAMNATLAVMSNGNATATFTPAVALANSTLYKIRVTTAAQGANGAPLAFSITSPSGWTTAAGVVTNQLNGSNGLDWFGSCIAADGNYAVIGAKGATVSESGGYTIAKKVGGGWIQLQVINGYIYGFRNTECAISGSYVALRTSQTTIGIFKNNGSDVFTQTTSLVGFDPTMAAFSNGALALFGNILVIGSPTSSIVTANDGAVFIFQKNPVNENWDFVQRLDPSTSSTFNPGPGFGSAVATNGAAIAVTSSVLGNVGIFEKDISGVWQITGIFTVGPNVHVGDTLALSTTGTLVVSAIQAGVGVPNTGAAFIVEKDSGGNWNMTAQLLPNDGMPLDKFGFSVAIQNDVIAIGAQGESGGAGDLSDPLFGRGAIYTFQKDNAGIWQQINKYDQLLGVTGDPNGRATDALGFSVAISNDTVLGGAINTVNGGLGAQRGTVWAYPAP